MKPGVGLTAIFVFAANIVLAQGPQIPPLRPPHGDLAPTFWEQYGLYIIAAGVFSLLVIALLIFLLRRPRVVVPVPPAIAARRALAGMLNRAEDGALVAEVTRVVRRYVMDAFSFPAEELTTTEFRKALQTNTQIAPELATATGDFLRRCDEWKFAPAPPAPKLGAVGVAMDLVNRLEASRAPVPAKTS